LTKQDHIAVLTDAIGQCTGTVYIRTM